MVNGPTYLTHPAGVPVWVKNRQNCHEHSVHFRSGPAVAASTYGRGRHLVVVPGSARGERALVARLRSVELLCVELGHKVANKGDQFLSVLDGILKRLVAADEEARGTKFVVGKECLRHRLRGANKRRRITPRARHL